MSVVRSLADAKRRRLLHGCSLIRGRHRRLTKDWVWNLAVILIDCCRWAIPGERILIEGVSASDSPELSRAELRLRLSYPKRSVHLLTRHLSGHARRSSAK